MSLALAGLAAPAFAWTAGEVHISCFRGPWKEVIWDRPNPEFIDSLVNQGYSLTTATDLAHRICRDPGLVNNRGALRSETVRIINRTPRDSGYGY
ncbi:hypothetical protein [Pseudoponticoccus marisrubri]|uniref:Uncharacterized protein n=1 Tax=Pseudoponticoccus marisrubri TaxID=1685382 RepID=A0A0W7WKV7_9RHOB|nr:hypothetical protein [Pseudoponticoccus marisrubri]KUF11112.1 hypothetical protein AVJ23_08635 [Pseudoponticoccus marisrubri]